MYQEIIAISLIVLIVGGAILYIVKAKKSGQKCIGCPYAKQCSKNKSVKKCCCDNKE